jgi:hypothetical protein
MFAHQRPRAASDGRVSRLRDRRDGGKTTVAMNLGIAAPNGSSVPDDADLRRPGAEVMTSNAGYGPAAA